jgi:hypothetical protein
MLFWFNSPPRRHDETSFLILILLFGVPLFMHVSKAIFDARAVAPAKYHLT